MVRDAEVDAQLRRILESSTFIASPRSTQFLQFCVERALCGETRQLKETTIAIEVFNRAADYDPKVDPIVRVHARRVREKLETYYRTVGSDDPIKIDLPKGGYVPQILRTLPRRKTDFGDWESPVAALTPPPSVLTASPPGAPPTKSRAGLVWSLAGVSLVLLALLASVFWRAKRPAETIPATALRPLDGLPANLATPSWSPDGKRMAFTGSEVFGGTSHVYWMNLNAGGAPTRLTTGDSDELRPVWSPDGSSIAFARRDSPSHFEVVVEGLGNGAVRSLGRFVTYWVVRSEAPALDWSADGRYLVTSEQTIPGHPVRLVLISVATGERTMLTSPPISSSGDIEAKFSPDSQWVAFRRGGMGDLCVVSIRGEQATPATRLTFEMKGVRGIAWVDHGRSILFASRRGVTEAFGLWKIAAEGGTPVAVSPADFDAVDPAVSSLGTLVLNHRQLTTELMEQTIDGKSKAATLLASHRIDSYPVYAPNGDSFAFLSTRSGPMELWLYRKGGQAPTQLTHFEGAGLMVLAPAWSPDSRSLVFSFRQQGATNLYRYDLSENALRPLTATRNRDMSPAYSADGKYIYYSSNDDGASRLWRIRADGSNRPEPLFLEVAGDFLPSPDGKWLYFIQGGEQLSLSRRSLIDGTTEELFHLAGTPTLLNDLAIAHGLVYFAVTRDSAVSAQVFAFDPDTRSAKVVARLNDLPPLEYSGFSISPAGDKLSFVRTKRSQDTFYTATLAQ